MKSDNQNPLAYFEYLLKYNRYTELKEEFLNSYRDFTSLEYINFQKGEVKLWEFFYDESKNIQQEKIIETVHGYFKGQNEYREQIMTIESYTKMIGYISYFIENNILPENLEKIPPLGISKQLLRFSFWVLHKHLYSNKRTNLEFLSLVKSMFSDFDDWEFETLKKKFGNKDKVTVNGLMFVPEIIKKEIKRSY